MLKAVGKKNAFMYFSSHHYVFNVIFTELSDS